MPSFVLPSRRRRLAGLVGALPSAFATALLLGAVAGALRTPRTSPAVERDREVTERVTFAVPGRRADAPAEGGTGTRPSRRAPSRATVVRPTEPLAPPEAPLTTPTAPPPTSPTPIDPRLLLPAPWSPPRIGRPLRLETARPDHAPLTGERADSARDAMRDDLSARARIGDIPTGREDAAKALAPVGEANLSADGRRALARAVLEDERRRVEEVDRRARGLRPALRLERRIGGGPRRPPPVSAAEVGAMLRRNEERVRRRRDSLARAAESELARRP